MDLNFFVFLNLCGSFQGFGMRFLPLILKKFKLFIIYFISSHTFVMFSEASNRFMFENHFLIMASTLSCCSLCKIFRKSSKYFLNFFNFRFYFQVDVDFDFKLYSKNQKSLAQKISELSKLFQTFF